MLGQSNELPEIWSDLFDELSTPLRVLVVDDEPAVSEMLAAVVGYAGYECEISADGEDALARLADSRFHLVVVDKNLPDITGLQVIEGARQIDSDCEAAVLTGYPSTQSILQAIELRRVDYLAKPLDSIDIITALLGRARQRRNRRLLVRGMLAGRGDLGSEPVQNDLVEKMRAACDRVKRFGESLADKRTVVVWQGEEQPVHSALELLPAAGMLVRTAGSGSEVVDTCLRRHVSVLIVSDGYGDMTGAEIVAEVTKKEGHPELVYITAYDGFDNALAAANAGAASYIIKPLADPGALVDTVRRAGDVHHERLLQFKMIAELYAVLDSFVKKPDSGTINKKLETALSDFDLNSAHRALQGVEEDAN